MSVLDTVQTLLKTMLHRGSMITTNYLLLLIQNLADDGTARKPPDSMVEARKHRNKALLEYNVSTQILCPPRLH
jgi:hypothetical protein